MTQLVRKASSGVRTGGSPYCLPQERKRPVPFPAVRRSYPLGIIGASFYELMTTLSALPVRHSFRDAATAEDNIPAFKHFEAFGAGLSIDDEYDFAAAVRAFRGFARYKRDIVFFLVHSVWFYIVIN